MNDIAATPLRILLVEDSPDDAKLIMLRIEQEGLIAEYQRVDNEADFTAALDSPPNLILSDYALPQFNGLHALRILKENGLDIPFILVSGAVGEDVAVDAIKQGADDYVMKDRLARLGSAVRHALEQKRLREEKMRADDALKASELRFRSLIEFSHDAIALGNAEGIITYMSPPTSRIMGYAPEELVGRPGIELIHPDDREYLLGRLAEILQNPEITVTVQYRIQHKDGSWRWVEAVVRNLLNTPGVGALVGNYRDITKRKQAEDALRESEERYRLISENAADVICRLDPVTGEFSYFSPSVQKLLGYTPAEAVGKKMYEWMTPDSRKQAADWLAVRLPQLAALKSGTFTYKDELDVIRKDGSIITIEAASTYLRDESGRLEIIAVVRDITERSRVDEVLRRKNEYLALLNDMTRAILLSEDLDSTLHTLAIDMAKLMDASDCFITRWDPTQEQISTYVSSVKPGSMQLEIKMDASETSLSASVLRAGHALVVEDAPNSPYMNSRIVEQFSTRSAIGVPLIVGSHKLGAAIISFRTSREFTPEELQRAEQAGAQIALALWNAQQESRIQQRLRESGALSDIGRALSETEHGGTAKVLQLIVDSARELIPEAEQSVIHLLDKEKQSLLSQAVSGFSGDEKEAAPLRMRLGAGVAGQVIHEGITINIGDIETDPRFLRPDSTAAFRSLLVAPVQSGGQQIGTISVQSNKPNAFSAGDVELIKSFGIQAAIAIENTHLFETTQNSLKEVNALYQISRGLVSSLDANQLIKDSVDLLQTIFGYYSVRIYLVDDESGDLIMSHASGVNRDQLIREGIHVSAGEGIIGHVAETKSPFVTNNAEEVVFFRQHPLTPDTQSEMAVPILSGGQVVGVLDIQHTQANQLTESDLQLMVVVADQLSVALQKANLYASLQTSLRQEQEMRSQLIQSERLALVGRLLASVSHELNNPLQAIQNALFLLKDETQLSTQASQDLDIILAEAERMAVLIERLRSAYRPMRFKDFQPVQLNDLIEDVHALIATHVRHKEIAFEFYPEPDLPAISGLPDQIRQVALNLFINAVEVMKPGGRLIVRTRCLLQQNEILLSVKDTGPGIDGEILPKIFDPFITDKHTGTGLGLTITHDIIQQHHGRIEAYNDPQGEGGAVFNVWLPIDDAEGME